MVQKALIVVVVVGVIALVAVIPKELWIAIGILVLAGAAFYLFLRHIRARDRAASIREVERLKRVPPSGLHVPSPVATAVSGLGPTSSAVVQREAVLATSIHAPIPPASYFGSNTSPVRQDKRIASEPREFSADGLVFLDVETTGLDERTDRIIEIAAFVLNSGAGHRIQDGLGSLINPGRPLPHFITQLTGITDEMLAEARPASVVIPEFLDYIGARTICAYNAEFDIKFLSAEAARLGRQVGNQSLCVMELARAQFPRLKSYKLADVCNALNITCESSAHRAAGDAERALRLWVAISQGKEPDGVETRYGDGDGDGDGDGGSDMNIYYVYGHYSPTGTLFYVGVGHGDRAWSDDLGTMSKWYVEKKLKGKFEVVLIRERLTSFAAASFKDQLMSEHAETLLNVQNIHRGADWNQYEKFHSLRNANREKIKRAKDLEKLQPDVAIKLLMESLDEIEGYAFMKLESGLFGDVRAEMNGGYKGELEALNRLTILLCGQKRGAEARQIADRYFARFKGDAALAQALPIMRRVRKATVI